MYMPQATAIVTESGCKMGSVFVVWSQVTFLGSCDSWSLGECAAEVPRDVARSTQCLVTAAVAWWLAALVTVLLQGMSGRDAPVSSVPSLVLASDVPFVAKVAIKFSKKFT